MDRKLVDSFPQKKLCSWLSSSEVRAILEEKRPFCVFVAPPLGDLGATYDNHLRLIGKRVVNFLLVLIELFSLGVTAVALRAIICSKSAISLQQRLVEPKFQVEGVAPTNHSSSQKTRLNDNSFIHSFIHSFIYLHQTNGPYQEKQQQQERKRQKHAYTQTPKKRTKNH